MNTDERQELEDERKEIHITKNGKHEKRNWKPVEWPKKHYRRIDKVEEALKMMEAQNV
jgi:hypothetical protein